MNLSRVNISRENRSCLISGMTDVTAVVPFLSTEWEAMVSVSTARESASDILDKMQQEQTRSCEESLQRCSE